MYLFFLNDYMITIKNKVSCIPRTVCTSLFLLLHGTFQSPPFLCFAFKLLPRPFSVFLIGIEPLIPHPAF